MKTTLEVDLDKISQAVEDTDGEQVLRSYTKAREHLTDREIVEAAMGITGTAAASFDDEALETASGDATATLLAVFVLRGLVGAVDENGQILVDAEPQEEGSSAE